MSILALVLAPLVLLFAWRRWQDRRRVPTWVPDPDATPIVAFVRIPLPLGPLDRHERFEVPLDLALRSAHVGRLTDGAMLCVDGVVLGSTIELQLGDPDRAVPLAIEILRAGGAPPETTIAWTTPDGTREARVGAVA